MVESCADTRITSACTLTKKIPCFQMEQRVVVYKLKSHRKQYLRKSGIQWFQQRVMEFHKRPTRSCAPQTHRHWETSYRCLVEHQEYWADHSVVTSLLKDQLCSWDTRGVSVCGTADLVENKDCHIVYIYSNTSSSSKVLWRKKETLMWLTVTLFISLQGLMKLRGRSVSVDTI